jgi:hypothetical protein
MKARTKKQPSPKTRTTPTPAVDAADAPPQYESAISQADLDKTIRALKLGLRPPLRFAGPLQPEIQKVLSVMAFLRTVFADGHEMDMEEAADGLAELMDQLVSQLEDLSEVAQQRDELHGYSASENGSVQ